MPYNIFRVPIPVLRERLIGLADLCKSITYKHGNLIADGLSEMCVIEWLKPMRAVLIFGLLMTIVALPVRAEGCEDNANSMAEVRTCMSKEQDLNLAAVFNSSLLRIRTKDAVAARLLVKAQSSWEQFVVDSCEYSSMAHGSPSQYPEDITLSCRKEFIDARIRILDSYGRRFESISE